MSLATVALVVAVMGAGAALGNGAQSSSRAVTSASQGLLMRGSQGTAVQAVQRALGMNATGFFGRVTEANVRAFQRQHGLAVDGIVGPQTRAALGLGGTAPAQDGSSGETGTSGQANTSGQGSASGQAGSSGRASATQSSTSAPASGALQRIAQCESSGNPRAVGGGGRYRGKYQFTRETWAAVGGSGDPAAASEAEQDQRAAMLYARGGASSWPTCGG